MAEEQIYEVLLKDIRVSDCNVRHHDPDADIEELANSIREHGLLQPVVLLGSRADGPPYQLIVGQRRLRAHKRLGMKTIRARFAGKLDDVQARIRSLVENVQRVPLNHADAADAVTGLYKQFGEDERKVAKSLGLSLRRVRQYLDVKERATAGMLLMLRKGKVTLVDVKRALDAAPGDTHKAERLLASMRRLPAPAKKRAVEYGSENPKATEAQIITEASKPQLRTTVLIDLPPAARRALDDASSRLAMGAEEVAARAVTEWLVSMGFLPA